MTLGRDIRYLCDADIRAAGLSLAEVEAAVEAVFAAKAAGRAVMKPKLSLHAPGGALFLASAGVLGAAYGGVKWVGVVDAAASGLPHIAGTVLLNDSETGMPVAILDARWITGVRTAAITAVAARRLARPERAHRLHRLRASGARVAGAKRLKHLATQIARIGRNGEPIIEHCLVFSIQSMQKHPQSVGRHLGDDSVAIRTPVQIVQE